MTPPPAAPAAPKAPEAAKPAESAAPAATTTHAKVGATKCKMCHRAQYTSWAESPHKEEGLDCEGCHGNGADYKSRSVMKDRAAAVKAGLILPGVSMCKKCHADATPALLPKAHAHKK